MNEDNFYYIMDYSGNYYRLNGEDELVVADVKTQQFLPMIRFKTDLSERKRLFTARFRQMGKQK